MIVTLSMNSLSDTREEEKPFLVLSDDDEDEAEINFIGKKEKFIL